MGSMGHSNFQSNEVLPTEPPIEVVIADPKDPKKAAEPAMSINRVGQYVPSRTITQIRTGCAPLFERRNMADLSVALRINLTGRIINGCLHLQSLEK